MATTIENLLWELKDIFTLSYKDLKGIPPHIAKHESSWTPPYYWHIKYNIE
jgi:hypothetical protein